MWSVTRYEPRDRGGRVIDFWNLFFCCVQHMHSSKDAMLCKNSGTKQTGTYQDMLSEGALQIFGLVHTTEVCGIAVGK